MPELNNILLELIFILLHFFLFAANFFIMKRKIMNPAVLFSLLWFSILLLHFIFSFTLLDELFPLTLSSYVVFFVGALAFSFGSFIQTVLWQKKKIFSNNKNCLSHIYGDQIALPFRFFLLAIVVIGLPFFLVESYKIYITSNVENFFIGLRTELVYGDEDIGSLKYLLPFSFVTYTINLQSYLKEKNQKNKILFIISLLVTIIYAIFTTGRIIFLAVLAVYIGMSFIFNSSFSVIKFLLPILIFLIIFTSFGIIYGKGGDLDASIKENIKPAAQTTAIYMVASLNAFDLDMHHQFRVNYSPDNSLRFFIKLGRAVNLISHSKENDLLTPFVFVPYPTNVYTFYSPYIRDFGRFYSWFMIALFGFIHTFLYNKAISTRSLRYSLYYSIMLFPLLISFFADQYLTLTSFWFQILFFTEAIIFFNKFFDKKKW